MKKINFILIILLFFILCSCSAKPTVINYRMDKLSYDYITNDAVVLLKNIYSPAKTKIVYYSKVNKKWVESIENKLRVTGYSVRNIKNEKANIYQDELFINFIIDRVKDTTEEKRIKYINNDNSKIIRLSVLVDDKMFTRLYKLHKTYEITPASRWLQHDIIISKKSKV